MRYQIPQFIDIETKIFGPLTFPQFTYLVGGGGTVFVMYAILPLWLVFIFGLPVAGLAVALAFYKVNNKPFIEVVEYAFKYFFSPKLFLWKKNYQQTVKMGQQNHAMAESKTQIYVPKFAKSKLKDLAWSLDIKEEMK